MSLGWGWRGYIGGGPYGAMIPGAMVALTLCRLLGLNARRSAVAAAFAAVGVGFGGEMTYGQTVGFVRQADTFWLGFAGLALKGGVWGLLGGAVTGMGFHIASGRPSRPLPALGAFAAAVVAGWALINHPKLIYFSNLADRPREEVWAGLLFGAVALLLVYVRTNEEAQPLHRFALAGSLGGFFGFGLGGCWMLIGTETSFAPAWTPWWKLMEFTFGLLFGLALGWAAYREREWLTPVADIEKAFPARWPPPMQVALLAAVSTGLFIITPFVGTEFNYCLIGAGLLAAAALRPETRWPIAIAVTATAFFLDWFDYALEQPPAGSIDLGIAITATATLIVCAAMVALERRGGLNAASAFWLLTIAAMITSWGRVLVLHSYEQPGELAEHAFFTALLLAILSQEPKSVETSAPAA